MSKHRLDKFSHMYMCILPHVLSIAVICFFVMLLMPRTSVFAVPRVGSADDQHVNGGCRSITFELLTQENIPSDGAIGDAESSYGGDSSDADDSGSGGSESGSGA